MIKGRIDISGWDDQLRGLNAIANVTVPALVQDGAVYYKGRLLNNVIAGQYVGVISGQLRRSFGLRPLSARSIEVKADLTVASYAPRVLRWSAAKWGRNYLQITTAFYGKDIIDGFQEEIAAAVRAIGRGRIPKYSNPYPFIPEP